MDACARYNSTAALINRHAAQIARAGIADFATYEDYLDAQITQKDLDYLEVLAS